MTVRVVGLDHVQVAMPVGGEAAARAFYVDVLGLEEVEKPAAMVARGGCWFAGPRGVAIHLGIESAFVPARKAHPALVVADLAGARTLLLSAGVPVEDDNVLTGVDRCYINDPFGNRLELIAASGAGFSESGGRVAR